MLFGSMVQKPLADSLVCVHSCASVNFINMSWKSEGGQERVEQKAREVIEIYVYMQIWMNRAWML